MKELVAQANGEHEATVEGMFERGSGERSGAVIAEGKEQSAEEREADGEPVTEDDVDERERERADQDEDPASPFKIVAVAAEEEDAVDDALWINGDHGIEQHDACPDPGTGTRHVEKEIRRPDPYASGNHGSREGE